MIEIHHDSKACSGHTRKRKKHCLPAMQYQNNKTSVWFLSRFSLSENRLKCQNRNIIQELQSN